MAILDNWEQVADAQEVAANSAGTSEQKYDIYLNSMQAHINELKTTWSEFLMNLADSGAINAAIDALSGVVKVIDVLTTNPVAATAAITALVVALGRLAAIKLADLGTSIIKMTASLVAANSAQGANSIVNGFKSLLGILPAAASGTEAVGIAGFSAAGGFAALGSSIMALLPTIGVIAAVAAAVYLIGKAAMHVVNENKELEDSIQEHQDNVKSLQTDIDGYNKSLDENNSKLSELNALKASGDATASDEKEIDLLTKKNDLLQQQIELAQRKKEIEQSEADKDTHQLFANTWNTDDQTTTDKFKDFWTQTGAESGKSGADLAAAKVDNYNKKVDRYNKLLEEQKRILDDNNSTEEQRTQIQNGVDQALDDVTKSENDLLDMRTDLLDQYDHLNDGDKKIADGILEQFNNMKMANSEFATYGEYLDYMANASEHAGINTQSLAEQFKELAGSEIKPKDADSMDEWLSSLSNTDLAKVQDVLMNCGDYADELSAILSNMSGADAASYLVDVYNDFYGILQDCTEAYDEFNNAVNKNYDEEVTKYGEMLDYALKSSDPSKGVKNWEAYKASLKGVGLTSEATRQDILNLQKSLQDYVGFDADGSMYVDTDKFRDKIFELIDADQKLGDESKKLGTVNTQTGEISIKNYKALASAMGIPEQAFHALLESAKAMYDISEETQFTALQNALSDVTTKAQEAKQSLNDMMHGLVDKQSIDEAGNITYTLKTSLDNGTKSATEARVNLTNEIAKQKQELENVAQQAGIDIKIEPKLDFEKPESNDSAALSEAASVIHNTSNQMQQLIDDNFNFDTDKIKNIASEINNSLGEGSITIDGDNIKFDNTKAATAFTESLQKTFSNLNVASIINNAMASGLTFTTGSNTGADAFKGITDSALNSITEGIKNATSGKEIQMKVAIEDNASEGLGVIGDAADDMKKKLQNAANISLSGTSSNIQNCGNVASDAQSSVSRLASALNSLPKEKTVKLTYSYHESGSLPNLFGPPAKKGNGGQSANGRDMPAYAQGKDPQMGEPIRTVSNANSLVGEEGKERVITATGQQYDVGVNGAELVHLHKGDTVLPANVTKLLDEGKLEQHAHNTTPSSGGSVGSSGTFHGGAGKHTVQGFTSKYDGTSSSNKSHKSSHTSSGGSSGGSSGSSSGGSSSSKSSSGSGKSSTSGTNDAAENELKVLEHQRKMEYITEKQYSKKYEAIWKKYYKGKSEYRDKDFEMQEKLHDLQKTFFEDRISMLEEENDKLQRNAGTEQQQIANYQQMQKLYHDRAAQYRKQGFADDSPEIRELSKKWWDMYDKINDLRTQMFDNYINDFDHTIDLIDERIGRIDDYVIRVTKKSAMAFDELEKDLGNYLDNKISLYKQKAMAINAQLVAVNTELNRLYKEGYEKNKENIQKLEKQAEELKNNIHDVAENIRQENLDNIQRELDYQEQLRSAVKQYAQDQVDKIQDQIDKLEEENDALDKQKEKKKLLEALDSSKQKNKRVYYADKGWVNYMPIINYIG